jgi:hypothetical protein
MNHFLHKSRNSLEAFYLEMLPKWSGLPIKLVLPPLLKKF